MILPASPLPQHLTDYLQLSPTEAKQHDRSETELEIVSALDRAGFSEAEIHEWFRHHRPHRYAQERQPESWLNSLIRTARKSNEAYTRSISAQPRRKTQEEEPDTPHTCDWDHDQSPPGLRDSPTLRFLVLKALREREERGEPETTLTPWREEVVQISSGMHGGPVCPKTAQRLTDKLCTYGYVEKVPLDGKTKLATLTDKGRTWSIPVRGKWCRAVYFEPPLAPADTETDPEDVDTEPSPNNTPPLDKGPRRTADPLKARARQRKKNLLNGHYRHCFEGSKVRHIQLLLPPDEWVTALVWSQLVTGYDHFCIPIYKTILSPADPTIAQADPLRPIMPWTAREMTFAPAADLTESKSGFEIATHTDETGESHLSIGLIMQAQFNFFRPLNRLANLDRIIRVKATGSTRRRKDAAWRTYNFADAGPAIDLQDATFDFDAFLADLEKPDRLEHALAVPRGWFFMPPKRQALVERLLKAPSSPQSRSVAEA